MALQALEEQIREMMQCKICLDDKDTQKQLPCQHTLCLECLNSLKVADSKYKCPLCLRELFVPNGGFESLPDSLFTKQLASIVQQTELARKASEAAETITSADSSAQGKPEGDGTHRPTLKFKPVFDKSEELLGTAEEKRKVYEELVSDWEITEQKMEDKIHSLLEEKVNSLKEKSEAKIAAIKEIIKSKRVTLKEKLEQLHSASSNTKEMVERLKSSTSVSHDHDSELKEASEVLQSLRDVLSSTSESSGKFKAGDSVRLRVDVELLKPSFLEKKLDHLSVGYIHEINSKGDCAVLFPGLSGWVGNTSKLDKSNVAHGLPVLGDLVKVKDSVEEPFFKWGGTKRGDIGTLREIRNRGPNSTREVIVDFPDSSNWKGIFDELETVAPEPLKVGEEVWIHKAVHEPERGWAGVTSNSIGTLISVCGEDVVVRFPECAEWRGLLSEIERVRSIMVGDKVRVLKTVSEPQSGWAGITHQDEGIVKMIKSHPEYGKVAKIDFPNRVGLWSCLLSELELVDRHASGGSRGEVDEGDLRQAMRRHQRMMNELGGQQCESQ